MVEAFMIFEASFHMWDTVCYCNVWLSVRTTWLVMSKSQSADLQSNLYHHRQRTCAALQLAGMTYAFSDSLCHLYLVCMMSAINDVKSKKVTQGYRTRHSKPQTVSPLYITHLPSHGIHSSLSAAAQHPSCRHVLSPLP